MTKSKMLTVALIIVLAVLAVAAWFMFGRTAGGMVYPDADKYTVGNETVTGTVNSLFIDWTSGRVNIEYHDGDGVIISETASRTLSDNDKLRWWLDGDTLRIRYAKPGFRVTVNLEKELTVSLPRDTVLKSADISSTSGDLNIPSLAADEIRLDSTSGSIGAGTETKKLTASSTSGDVTILQESDLDTAALNSTSGSLSLSLKGSVKTVTADSTSGSVALTVSGTAENVRMHSTSGNLCPDFSSVEQADIGSTSGGVTGTVAAFRYLKVGTTSGSVSLKLGTEPGFTCKVSSSSGDFNTALSLTKNGDTYTCGDGSAKLSIDTTSGNIRIEKAD